MEMPATRIGVIGDLGDEIGKQVRRCGVRSGVKLRTQGSVEGRGEDNFCALSGELLRVFQGEGPGKLVIRVPGYTELGSTSKVGAYVMVAVFVERGEYVP